jgi:hypothetical protein
MPKQVDRYQSFTFNWVPGYGPSDSALESLHCFFPRHPPNPPGNDSNTCLRRKYTELVEQPMNLVPADVIQDFLLETMISQDAFPDAVSEIKEWIAWSKYILPFGVSRAHEGSVAPLLETVCVFAWLLAGKSHQFGRRIA